MRTEKKYSTSENISKTIRKNGRRRVKKKGRMRGKR
jgi:hypothetical protein